MNLWLFGGVKTLGSIFYCDVVILAFLRGLFPSNGGIFVFLIALLIWFKISLEHHIRLFLESVEASLEWCAKFSIKSYHGPINKLVIHQRFTLAMKKINSAFVFWNLYLTLYICQSVKYIRLETFGALLIDKQKFLCLLKNRFFWKNFIFIFNKNLKKINNILNWLSHHIVQKLSFPLTFVDIN